MLVWYLLKLIVYTFIIFFIKKKSVSVRTIKKLSLQVIEALLLNPSHTNHIHNTDRSINQAQITDDKLTQNDNDMTWPIQSGSRDDHRIFCGFGVHFCDADTQH